MLPPLLALMLLQPSVNARCDEESAVARPVPCILSTDLSLDRDPDDWFDTVVFLTLPNIEPRGIILDHYATDEVVVQAQRLLKMLGRTNVPVVKGVQGRLEKKDDRLTAPPHHDGAEFLIESLRSSESKVTLIAVGGLTNEALAFSRASALFRDKVAALYFCGGNPFGVHDTNVNRDTLAVEILLKADIPVHWVPCTQFQKQKLTGVQERQIKEMNTPVSNFLTEMLIRWRAFRGKAWLKRTNQVAGQGKNLWSLPVFMEVATTEVTEQVWLRGHAHFDPQRWTWFETDPRGPDRMLIQADPARTCDWVVEHIGAVHAERQ